MNPSKKIKLCCVFQNSKCNENVTNVTKLSDNITKYLASLFPNSKKLISERLLIENRGGIQFQDHEYICDYHRRLYGTRFSASKGCKYPEHKSNHNRQLRTVPLKYALEIPGFIIGNKVCLECNFLMKKSVTQEQEEEQQEEEEEQQQQQQEQREEQQQEEQQGGEQQEERQGEVLQEENQNQASPAKNDNQIQTKTKIEIDPKRNAKKQLELLTSVLGISPVKYQLNKDVQNCSRHVPKYVHRKITEMTEKLSGTVCELFAPGQGEALHELISVSHGKMATDGEIPKDLIELVAQFKATSHPFIQKVILSLAPNSYKYDELIKYFGCSEYAIKMSRRMKKTEIEIPKQGKRDRLDDIKIDHFYDWLMQHDLLQEMAYGARNVSYSDGTKQLRPNVILNSLKSQVIEEYLSHCQENEIPSFCRATLFKILKIIKPCQKTSLAGLDDIVADGIEAFKKLKEIVTSASGFRRLEFLNRLDESNDFLKRTQIRHLSEASECLQHCTAFALSDPKNAKLQQSCDHQHSSSCSDCTGIFELMDDVKEYVQSHTIIQGADGQHLKNILMNDIALHRSTVIEWFTHNVRAFQQSIAKEDAMKMMNETTAFIIRDWSMKFLPRRFREGMNPWFGKKGLSNHVMVCQFVKNGQMFKRTYMDLLNDSDQGMLDTMCVTEHALQQLHKDEPQIKNVAFKNDGASCYEANYHLEILAQICKNVGLNPIRLDYNEPGKGKDQADRESALGKGRVRNYVNAGNNVTTAEEYKSALLHKCADANFKVAIIKIDSAKTKLQGFSKIKNIMQFKSVAFGTDGLTLHRYYKIGIGVGVEFSITKPGVFRSSIETESPYTGSTRENSKSEKARKSLRGYLNLQCCSLCESWYQDAESLKQHMAEDHFDGNDEPRKKKYGEDKIKSNFGHKLKFSAVQKPCASTLSNSNIHASTAHAESETLAFFTMGWALKIRHQSVYTNDQWNFLFELFHLGETTSKISPQRAEEQMKLARTDTDLFRFKPEEVFTASKIKDIFNRMKQLHKKGELRMRFNEKEQRDQFLEGAAAVLDGLE